MRNTLQEIYFDVMERIYLNSRPEASKHKIARDQIVKDEKLKTEIEKVFINPKNYDVYYHKDTLQLHIEKMPEESGLKKNLFNRIEIQY